MWRIKRREKGKQTSTLVLILDGTVARQSGEIQHCIHYNRLCSMLEHIQTDPVSGISKRNRFRLEVKFPSFET